MPYADKKKQTASAKDAARRSRESAPEMTADLAHAYLDYDPVTGVLRRKRSLFKRYVGQPAGKIDSSGHRQVLVCGRHYAAHRLIWLMTYGVWPSLDIDHVNGDPADNRLSNLRECTASQNQANAKTRKDNTTGRRGVFLTQHGTWTAYLQVGRRTVLNKTFKTKVEAETARQAAEAEHQGEFARKRGMAA